MARFPGNYDKFPETSVSTATCSAWQKPLEIKAALERALGRITKPTRVIAVDCYPGADVPMISSVLAEMLSPSLTVPAEEGLKTEQAIGELISRNVTEDRVFGVLSCHRLGEFFDQERCARLRREIEALRTGIVLVVGVGASLVVPPDLLVYADMARWEIQRRMRQGTVGNLGSSNFREDVLRKYKRAFFVDWRVADRHKASLYGRVDFFLDSNEEGALKLATGSAVRQGLEELVKRPFRLVPFFDPGPWGGQWMKQACGLDERADNFAWCFDCVPEENSLYLRFGDVRIEIPAINLVLRYPAALLGDRVHARFGAEFPIRFDFLDTMGGGNLSLQVHPLTEYIQNTFGMHYTQDESYYILDAAEDAAVYLGLKDGVDREAFLGALEAAQAGGPPLNADQFVGRWPAKKHDHFLIPAGTVHCSGKNGMVLEISSTPYIFTFKLWDWGRVGLDGRPRPIHLEHGKNVIQWDRDVSWVGRELVNRIETVAEGPGWREERTGLHEREFIETRRHWFSVPVDHDTLGGVHVLNLVEGVEATVESPDGMFEPYRVHYAETFIVPASVGRYRIRPSGESTGRCIATIQAFVRT